MVIKLILEKQGYVVHALADPRLALEHIEKGGKGCSIAVSDIRMPHMTGLELVKYLKKIRLICALYL